MKNLNRRNFLAGSLKSTAAASVGLRFQDIFKLYLSILAGTVDSVQAQSTGQTKSRRYMNFHLSGGPCRWTFDQWLTPNATDLTLQPGLPTWNANVITGFNNSGVGEHRLFTYKGLRVPILFQGQVSLTSGQKPLTQLLDHMAVIRGYDSLIDGHKFNRDLQLLPDPAVPSLNGLVADNRNDPMAAVFSAAEFAPFKSGTGKTIFTPGGGQILEALMRTFRPASSSKRGIASVDTAVNIINQFHDIVKTQVANHFPRGAITVDHLKSVKDLSAFAADSLINSQYTALNNKYRTVMINSAREMLNAPGFNSAPVLISQNEDNQSDIKHSLTHDFRDFFSTAVLDDSSINSFILADFCFSNDICGSLTLGSQRSLVHNISYKKPGGTTELGSMDGDQHLTSPTLACLSTAFYYRGLSAGLMEFINVLKSQNDQSGGTKFDNTVIHLTGDFGRWPRPEGDKPLRGTEHGYMNQVSSIFSGIIDTPFVVGNISGKDAYNAKGIWGVGAPVDFSGSKEILSPRHMAAGVAHALGSTNPWPFTPLVWQIDPTTKKLKPRVGAAIV